MTVISFEDYTPPARFDDLPWTQVRVEEAAAATGTWAAIDTIDLDPVDTDPANPAARNFTTEAASDTDNLWYRVVFLDATSDESQPSTPVQNTATATAPYTTVTELARILKIRTPTDEQTRAMERVLLAAAGEIDAEIDLDADTELSGWQLSLAAQVNLDRAADLWRHTESIPGITGLLGDEAAPSLPGRYSWERYAQRLAPLKDQFGIA